MATNDYRLCTQYECHVLLNSPAYFAGGIDEPVEIVIRRDATDKQLATLSSRFNVPFAEMKTFRETCALPWDAASHNPDDYVHIPYLAEGA